MDTSKRPLVDYAGAHDGDLVHWEKDFIVAKKRATAEAKPIFFCSGFASCHWCHVMAHESFQDPAIAAILDEKTVPLLVDRNLRPDLDNYFMTCAHATGMQGGWPLIGLCTPEGKPFWISSYLPRRGQGDRLGLYESLIQLCDYWSTDRSGMEATALGISGWVTQAPPPPRIPELSIEDQTLFLENTIEREGSRPPCFPQLWRYIILDLVCAGKGASLLQTLAHRPIVDPVGGLFRYATTINWLVPHYEKAAGNTALWIWVTAKLSDVNPVLAEFATASLDWLERELWQGDGSVLYFGTDADSPEGEGAHYLTTRRDLDNIVSADFWNDFALEEGLLVAQKGLATHRDTLLAIEQSRTASLAVDPSARLLDKGLLLCALATLNEKGLLKGEQKEKAATLAAAVEQELPKGNTLEDCAGAILGLYCYTGDKLTARDRLEELEKQFSDGAGYFAWKEGIDVPPVRIKDQVGGELPSGSELTGYLWYLLDRENPFAKRCGDSLAISWSPAARLLGSLLGGAA